MKRLLIILLAAIFLSSPVSALSSADLDFMDRNGIYYYNPGGAGNNCYPGLGTYDGVASAGLTDLQAAFVDKYQAIAAKLGAKYGIPWETVMAQGIIESISGTSEFAVQRNNFFGIGAFDSNPNAAKHYSNPIDGWQGYYENIKKTSVYSAHGAFNYPGDPYGYLRAIKQAGYATDPFYIPKVSRYIKAIEIRSQEKGWASSATIAKESGASLAGPSGGGGGGFDYSFSSCDSTTQGNGDLNSTALSLSWNDRSHSLTDPKPEYLKALGAVGLTKYGEKWVQIGASCDAFVATVLRFSGADPDVVCCGAANMLNYFRSHPEKYQEIPNTGNPKDLQPGDIRSKPSHVEMYVVDEHGQGRIASASHAGRTADHSRPFYADSSYRIFRLRKGSN